VLPSRPSRVPAPSAGLSVEPGSLTVAGNRLLTSAAGLASSAGEAAVVAELTTRALAVPALATAAAGFARAWGEAVAVEAGVLDHLAASLRSASWAYDDVETRLARTAR
jgi:hypothetical protein